MGVPIAVGVGVGVFVDKDIWRANDVAVAVGLIFGFGVLFDCSGVVGVKVATGLLVGVEVAVGELVAVGVVVDVDMRG